MSVRTRALAWSGGLSVLLVAVVLGSAGVGPVSIPPATVTRAVLGELLPSLVAPVARTQRVIVVDVRLPRILLAALVGFALATAGVVMQGFFRNPMADPSIIGVSSGAAVGAVVAIVLPYALPFGLELQGAAFASSLVTAFAVYLLATRDGHTPTATLLLAGVAVQTFLGAVISFVLLHSGQSLRRVVYWLMGHLSGTTWHEVVVVAAALPPLFLVLMVYTNDMNVLLLGEADAHSLGIEVERTKRVLLVVSSVVTAAAVAVSGVIGFVGLIVPHAMRLLVGPDHRVLLPASALAGASFLVAADTLARSGAAQVPVGIVTAAIGAPFFLYLLRTREVHRL